MVISHITINKKNIHCGAYVKTVARIIVSWLVLHFNLAANSSEGFFFPPFPGHWLACNVCINKVQPATDTRLAVAICLKYVVECGANVSTGSALIN
jgi:hypothetical protein